MFCRLDMENPFPNSFDSYFSFCSPYSALILSFCSYRAIISPIFHCETINSLFTTCATLFLALSRMFFISITKGFNKSPDIGISSFLYFHSLSNDIYIKISYIIVLLLLSFFLPFFLYRTETVLNSFHGFHHLSNN